MMHWGKFLSVAALAAAPLLLCAQIGIEVSLNREIGRAHV